MKTLVPDRISPPPACAGRPTLALALTHCLTLMLLPGVLAAPGLGVAWSARYDGPAHGPETPVRIAVDREANVYVAGASEGLGVSQDIAVVKYGSDGQPLWTARYDGVGHGADYPVALAIDPRGNVYVTGQSFGGIESATDFVTLSYAPDGGQRWVARYAGAGAGAQPGVDQPVALAVDDAGNVSVTGISDGPHSARDIATLRYDSTGRLRWATRFPGPAWPQSLDLGEAGQVAVTGSSVDAWTGEVNAVRLAYDENGNQVSLRRYRSTTQGWIRAGPLALDSDGNLLVTGGWHDPVSDAWFEGMAKFKATGAELWFRHLDRPAQHLRISPQGTVFVADDSEVTKVDAEGNTVWTAGLATCDGAPSSIRSIEVNRSDEVHLVGSTGTDFDRPSVANLVTKYGADGASLGTLCLTGARAAGISGYGGNLCLAFGLDGQAYVATDREEDWLTMKLVPTVAQHRAIDGFLANDGFLRGDNPNGPWAYGYRTANQPFIPLTTRPLASDLGQAWFWSQDGASLRPSIGVNPATSSVVRDLVLQPDLLTLQAGEAGEAAVVRWTAPADGAYGIHGRVVNVRLDRTNAPSLEVVLNASTVLTNLPKAEAARATPFALTRLLTAGDTLDFTLWPDSQDRSANAAGLELSTHRLHRAPRVSIVEPPDRAIVLAPVGVRVRVEVDGGEFDVTKLELHVNGSPLAASSNPPWVFDLATLTPAEYGLVARATDAAGLVTDSAPVRLSVLSTPGQGDVIPAGEVDRAMYVGRALARSSGGDGSAAGFEQAVFARFVSELHAIAPEVPPEDILRVIQETQAELNRQNGEPGSRTYSRSRAGLHDTGEDFNPQPLTWRSLGYKTVEVLRATIGKIEWKDVNAGQVVLSGVDATAKALAELTLDKDTAYLVQKARQLEVTSQPNARAIQFQQEAFGQLHDLCRQGPDLGRMLDQHFAEVFDARFEDTGRKIIRQEIATGVRPIFQALDGLLDENGDLHASLDSLKQLTAEQFQALGGQMAETRAVVERIEQSQHDFLKFYTNQVAQAELARKQQEEAQAYAQQIGAAQAGVSALGTLIGLFDQKLGSQVGGVGQGALRVWTAIHEFAKDPTAFASAILTGNVIGAVLDVVSLFGESGPSADELILQGLDDLKQQVGQLRAEMHERFDRVDAKLDRIYTDFSDRFDRIDAALGVLQRDLEGIQASLVEIQSTLNRLEATAYLLADVQQRRSFALQVGQALDHLTTFGTPLAPAAYEEAETFFYKWAVDFSTDEIVSPYTQRPLDDGAVAGQLRERPLEFNLSYLAAYVQQAAWPGVAPFGNAPLPNPRDWALGAKAYLQLGEENPVLFKRTSPRRLQEILETGLIIQNALTGIALDPATGGTRANRALSQALIDNYRRKAANLGRALNELVLSNKMETVGREDPQLRLWAASLDPWGTGLQPTPYSPPELTAVHPSTAGDTQGAAQPLALPSDWEQLIPNVYRLAEQLGLGHVELEYGDVRYVGIYPLTIRESVRDGQCPPWAYYGAGVRLVDGRSFAKRLAQEPRNALSAYVWNRLSPRTQFLLNAAPASSELAGRLTEDLNAIVRGPAIYSPTLFAGVPLRAVTRAWLEAYPERDDVGYLNEYLLEDAHPNELQSIVETPGRVYYPSDRAQRGRLQLSLRGRFVSSNGGSPAGSTIFSAQFTSPTDTDLPDSVRCPLDHSSTWSWPETLRSHWYERGVREQFVANAVERPEGLDQVSEDFRNAWVAVENKLRELQGGPGGIYENIARSIRQGPELQTVAQELSGAKALIEAFLFLGFPRSMEEDDFLRALVVGRDSLPDADGLVRLCEAGRQLSASGAAVTAKVDLVATLFDRAAALERVIARHLNELDRTGRAELPPLITETLGDVARALAEHERPLSGSILTVQLTPGGVPSFSLYGTANVLYAIQSSTNLLDWRDVPGAVASGEQFAPTQPAASGPVFYRAVLR